MTGKVRVTGPDVIAFAEKTKLDLSKVQASGPDGRISYSDVFQAHWEAMRPTMAKAFGLAPTASWSEIKGATDAMLRPRAVKAGLNPDTATLPEIKKREQELAAEGAATAAAAVSAPAATGRVAAKGPAYALNPRADASRKVLADAGLTPTSPAPTVFASGDLPSFTASGIPVDKLLDVPTAARHALAAAPTQAEAYAIYDLCTAGELGMTGEECAVEYADHPGNAEYERRVLAWHKTQAEAAIDEDAWLAQYVVDRSS